MRHHGIRPVERDCICPTRPTTAHSANCEAAFRLKFFGACNQARGRFYGQMGADSAVAVEALRRPDGV